MKVNFFFTFQLHSSFVFELARTDRETDGKVERSCNILTVSVTFGRRQLMFRITIFEIITIITTISNTLINNVLYSPNLCF